MRSILVCLGVGMATSTLGAQTTDPGRFPPDSLVNVQVIPRNTPVIEVVGRMRTITASLGVRCQFCHVGEEGMPLAQFDFPSDERRPKQVARQMMRMVQDINARLDTLPGRTEPGLEVTCNTCHRGVSRPVPLSTLVSEAGAAGGPDSALSLYRTLRERHYGRDAYDFGESSLNVAAFRLGRAGNFAAAFAVLDLNEELFPASSGMAVFLGNIHLMRGDTTTAAEAYREALSRDPRNQEARGRLRDIRRAP